MKSRNVPGQISRTLLILAITLLVVIGIVFLIIKLASLRQTSAGKKDTVPTETEAPKPVYTITSGDIKFTFLSAVNLGANLAPKNTFSQGLRTTERFIEVIITGQNKGKNNTTANQWSLGNIIDSEGRNFIARNDAGDWLPRPDLCGSVLKPEFSPTKCVKIYEVSNESKGLKIQVINTATQVKGQSTLIDISL